MNNIKISFIGAGNIARNLIGGLINKGFPAQLIWASNPNDEKLNILRNQFGINTTTDNTVAATQGNVIVLCVKPMQAKKVAQQLSTAVANHPKLILSTITGVRIIDLAQWLGDKNLPVVRSMPNTPALVGNSATGLFANTHTTEVQKELAESIMRSVGIAIWVNNENELDIVTALSGSGPAYFFYFMEALEAAGLELGLKKNVAHLLTIQTAFGAAHMALQSNLAIETLREQVTSPGGTTEQAIKLFEQNKLGEIIKKAVFAAKDRATELSKDSHNGEN